jgi:hypothetical protein
MDWGFAILAIFGLIGAALIAGGTVTYRASTRVSVRAGAAAAIAVGIVIWALILFVIPVSVTQAS